MDVVLLGRRTYETFAAYWPTASEDIAPEVNTVPKVVVSRTLDTAPWGQHDPAEVESDLGARLSRIREAGQRVLVWGSLSLIAALAESNELDELDLFVAPVVLGSGVPLLPATVTARLHQLQSKSWGSVTHLRYGVTR